MKNKIVISGCSYSAESVNNKSYAYFLKNKHLYDTIQLAIHGQSNDSITKKIYDFIIKNNSKNCLIICQLTYTHRIGWYHSFAKKWIDYQPKYINSIPEYDIENDIVKFETSNDETFMEGGQFSIPNDISKKDYKTLTEMYKIWLQYIYDEDEMFKGLMYKIDLLESYVTKTNNKIIFVYWPEISNEYQLNEIKNRNFFNINGEYSMLNWSTINNMINTNDSHLSLLGHQKFANLLDKEIKNTISLPKNKINLII